MTLDPRGLGVVVGEPMILKAGIVFWDVQSAAPGLALPFPA